MIADGGCPYSPAELAEAAVACAEDDARVLARRRAKDAAERLTEPDPFELVAALAKLAERHGTGAILVALRDACDASVGDPGWRQASRLLTTVAREVGRAERNTGVTLGQALEVLADNPPHEEG